MNRSATHVFALIILCLHINISGTVGSVIPGEPLWIVEKEVGATVDIIESKVCKLEPDFFTLGDLLDSKLDVLDSVIDLVSDKITLIDSEVDLLVSKVCLIDSQLDIVDSKVDEFSSRVDILAACTPTPITGSTTISNSGFYCLATTISNGLISIQADDVVLDLNGFQVSNQIIIVQQDQVTIKNGFVFGNNATDAIDVQSGSSNITIEEVLIKNAQRGIRMQNVTGGLIKNCEMTQNVTGLELQSSHKIVIDNSVAS